MFSAPVRLIVALPAEAHPLREKFNLKRRIGESAFPMFENRNICLIVSGVGKLAAAAATGYLLARDADEEPAVWVNIGIAGHGTLPIGTGLIAREVRDEATGQTWRAFVPPKPPFPIARVSTVDRPPDDYPAQRAIDMEAAGFCCAARKSVPEELTHCVKVVSDNRISGTEKINGAMVSGLIAGQLENILITLERLADVARRLRHG